MELHKVLQCFGECKSIEQKLWKQELDRLKEFSDAVARTKKLVKLVLFSKKDFNIRDEEQVLTFGIDQLVHDCT